MSPQKHADAGNRLAGRVVALLLLICAAYIARHANEIPTATSVYETVESPVVDRSEGFTGDVQPVRLSAATIRLREQFPPTADELDSVPLSGNDVADQSSDSTSDAFQSTPETVSLDPFLVEGWLLEHEAPFESRDEIEKFTTQQPTPTEPSNAIEETPSDLPAETSIEAQQSPAADETNDADEPSAETESERAKQPNDRRNEATENEVADPQGLTIRNPEPTVGEVRLTINGVPTTLKSGFMLQYPGRGPWQIRIQRGQYAGPPTMTKPGNYTIKESNGRPELRTIED
ncbi:MAG: hypothetical protein AAFX06_13120 [Planctomycetota bacterium]